MNTETTNSSISRRLFLAGSAAVLGAQAIVSGNPAASASIATDPEPSPLWDGPFMLAPLPYAEDALDPHISAKTMGIHYGKHHKGYVDKLNKAVEGKPFAQMKLEELSVTPVIVRHPRGAGITTVMQLETALAAVGKRLR